MAKYLAKLVSYIRIREYGSMIEVKEIVTRLKEEHMRLNAKQRGRTCCIFEGRGRCLEITTCKF